MRTRLHVNSQPKHGQTILCYINLQQKKKTLNVLFTTVTYPHWAYYVHFLALHWPPFCLQSPHKRFNTVLEFFLRNSEPYRHDSIKQWCESPVPPHSKDALLDANLVIVEAIWVQRTHHENPVWDYLSFMTVCYPAGGSHQLVGNIHS